MNLFKFLSIRTRLAMALTCIVTAAMTVGSASLATAASV
jgi:hypothetical protein